jgi:hypothetical protein
MLTLQELRCYVRRRLGSSAMNVELTDEDIDTGIEEGIDEINTRVPGEGYAHIDVTSAQKRYVINQRLLIDVTDLNFLNPKQATGSLSENPFLNINFNMGGGVPTDLTWVPPTSSNRSSMYTNTIGSQKDAGRVFSSLPIWDGDWEFNEDTSVREFALYIDIAEGFPEYLVTYRFLYEREATDADDRGLPSLTKTLEGWLKKYSVAASRELLGDIRNKWHGVPGPETMSTAEMDGESQITRGRESKEKLLEELQNMQRQLPPVVA